MGGKCPPPLWLLHCSLFIAKKKTLLADFSPDKKDTQVRNVVFSTPSAGPLALTLRKSGYSRERAERVLIYSPSGFVLLTYSNETTFYIHHCLLKNVVYLQ